MSDNEKSLNFINFILGEANIIKTKVDAYCADTHCVRCYLCPHYELCDFNRTFIFLLDAYALTTTNKKEKEIIYNFIIEKYPNFYSTKL